MIRLLVPLLFALLIITTGCNKDNEDNTNIDDEKVNPKVRIILSDDRVINLELYPNIAPISVNNFLKLVDQKFYDGLCFHRIISNFMVQTGGYYIEGNNIYPKESTETIKGEFSKNGVENNIKHELGVISMARTSEVNSASSQFFICTATSTHLDGSYAAFGKTIDEDSNKVLLDLDKTPTVYVDPSLEDFPYPPVIIKTIKRLK